MKRKIVKQGAATMMVSLPSKWCKENNIKKGDEVNIEVINNNLLVSPSAKEINVKTEIEITLTGLSEPLIRTLIMGVYRNGYDRIKVNYSSEEQFQILRDIIKNTILGFDIIKKEKNYCIIENITEPSYEQFENILQKIFLNINELFEITEQKFKRIKPSNDYKEIENRILQYDNFCRRIISKRQFENDPKLFWAFLTSINRAQREIYHLNEFLDKKKGNNKTTTTRLLELLNYNKEILKLIYQAYSKKDLSMVEKIYDYENTNHQKIYESISNVQSHYLVSCFRALYLSLSPLSSLLVSFK